MLVNQHPGMKIVPCDMCGGSGTVMHYPMRGNPLGMTYVVE